DAPDPRSQRAEGAGVQADLRDQPAASAGREAGCRAGRRPLRRPLAHPLRPGGTGGGRQPQGPGGLCAASEQAAGGTLRLSSGRRSELKTPLFLTRESGVFHCARVYPNGSSVPVSMQSFAPRAALPRLAPCQLSRVIAPMLVSASLSSIGVRAMGGMLNPCSVSSTGGSLSSHPFASGPKPEQLIESPLEMHKRGLARVLSSRA